MSDHPSYFQFLVFPSAIHWTAVCSRRTRVSFAFASVIQSTYSRLWLGGWVGHLPRHLTVRVYAGGTAGGSRCCFDQRACPRGRAVFCFSLRSLPFLGLERT